MNKCLWRDSFSFKHFTVHIFLVVYVVVVVVVVGDVGA